MDEDWVLKLYPRSGLGFKYRLQLNNTVGGIDSDYAYMIAVVCGDEQDGNHMTNAIGSSVKMQEYYQGVRAELKERFNAIVGSVMANKIAVLVPYEKPVMEYAERSLLIEKAREFVRDMRKRYSISFRVGISKVNELDKLSNTTTSYPSFKSSTQV